MAATAASATPTTPPTTPPEIAPAFTWPPELKIDGVEVRAIETLVDVVGGKALVGVTRKCGLGAD